ncbi:hypothetical protein TRVL_00656 [Trypanosoma vivax]|nr:hypothetical protein TRVL_00656 [Trypanosoma vivax]
MSKASYMMQDHLRRNFPLITDVHNPNVFLVRGTLQFPQGLAVLAALFRGKLAADVYSHPYFIEKQSDPSQPSPQLHLTEECQSVMKIIKGMHYMRDNSSRLDNTVVFATDYTAEVAGTVLTYSTPAEDAALEKGQEQRHGESVEAFRERLTKQRWQRGCTSKHKNRYGGTSSVETALRPFTLKSHQGTRSDDDAEKQRRFVRREGGYTVLYNPIDVDPATFRATLTKLHNEERVVKTIVVPTRQAWGSVRPWAEAFPDAEILCSGEKPVAPVFSGVELSAAPCSVGGGCMDMGNGLTGLSFPEVDVLREVEDVAVAAKDGEEARMEAVVTAAVEDINNMCRLYAQHASSDGWQAVDNELRYSPRVQPLSSDGHRQLTPNIELLRVDGDDQTNEYLLYDASSQSLSCTDLFHGEYGDLDPVNSWLCRVWFKFMRRGNYKRIDLVPEFKWLQVRQQGGLEAVHRTVDEVTKNRTIKYLLFAHGTPPLLEDPANALRRQWGMSPLPSHFNSPIPVHTRPVQVKGESSSPC